MKSGEQYVGHAVVGIQTATAYILVHVSSSSSYLHAVLSMNMIAMNMIAMAEHDQESRSAMYTVRHGDQERDHVMIINTSSFIT